MECPYCHKATSREGKLCVHCGKNIQGIRSRTRDPLQTKKCPVCRLSTGVITLAGVELDYCTGCSGIWFDKREMKQFEKNLTRGDSVDKVYAILEQPALQKNDTSVSRPAYIKCPVCSEVMIHKNYHEISGVILDQCMEHGTWAEKDDLVKILDFIVSGDLDALINKAFSNQQEELKKKIRFLESEQSAMKLNIARNRVLSRTHLVLDFLGFT